MQARMDGSKNSITIMGHDQREIYLNPALKSARYRKTYLYDMSIQC
jgi:hypothetical protein